MSLLASRAGIEKDMLAQADSVGELLEQFRSRISPELISGPGWEKLLARARALPVSLATTGFGFELPLHEHEPRADLGLGLFEGSLSAAHFEEWCASQPEDPSRAALVRLLRKMGRQDSALRRVAGKKLLLEYDIDLAHPGAPPDPGIFLYPADDALRGGGSNPEDLGVVADALHAACGREPDAAEHRQGERLFLAMPTGTHIGGVGAFPARSRALRVAIMGFRKTRDLTAFLERAGWPGGSSAFAPFVAQLEERDAFSYLSAHLDIQAEGLGPELGVSFYATDTQWSKDIDPWTGLIDGLREHGMAVRSKLAALEKSCAGADVMFARKGMLLVARGIHHIKLSLADDRVERVKAYVFFLVFPPPQS